MKTKTFFHSDGRRFLAILAVTFILYQGALALLTPPIAWVFAVLALGALACGVFIRKEWVTYAAITMATLFAVASGTEAYLYMTDSKGNFAQVTEGGYGSNWQRPDDTLGYRPKAQAGQTHAHLRMGEKTIYDVTYTTTAQGWRITPEHPDADTALVFLGCSFTIGEGVNDQESYPYVLSQLLGKNFQAYNFGFHGYGAHQAAALIEAGELDTILQAYSKVHVFFLNLEWHELRSGGFTKWDHFSPRYVLENGKAVRRGNFSPVEDPTSDGITAFIRKEVQKTLRKSFLYSKISTTPKERDRPYLFALQCAILKKIQESLGAKRSDATFTVVTYPGAEKNTAQFRAAGLGVLDALPFFPKPPTAPEYSIQGDGHPSALAHRLLAEGLVPFIRGGCVPPTPPTQ